MQTPTVDDLRRYAVARTLGPPTTLARAIARLGFPVFCDKATPRDIVGAWVPVAYDEPISYGQVVVRPGDHVLADCDGIVVIPGAIAASVIDAATAAMATEDKVRAAILSGVDPRQAYLDHGKF